jgi:GAF domain-containing protein
VVPLISGDRIFGVLDLDSPDIARFDAADQAGMEELTRIYVRASAL